VETTFGHGGSSAKWPRGWRCGDELRAVLTPSAGRNYPLIFPRQGRRYILNPNAQSQDKRARANQPHPNPRGCLPNAGAGPPCAASRIRPSYSIAKVNDRTDDKSREHLAFLRVSLPVPLRATENEHYRGTLLLDE